MIDNNQYSNEHINAYIDGELDNEDCASLLFEEQHDASLAKRINDARTLKDKVHLAYVEFSAADDIKKPFNCTAFVSKSKSLVAGLVILFAATALFLPTILNHEDILLAKQLIKETTPVSPAAIKHSIGNRKQIIINVSQYQPQQFDTFINNIETLLQQHHADNLFSIEIVANKNGLKALDTKTSLHIERITQLTKKFNHFKIVACAKTMAELAAEGNPITLMKSIMITPSTAEQVAKRMKDGWVFLKL